jgi:hypothetical protein
MQWWLQIEDKPRQGKRLGRAAKRPDPPFLGNAVSTKTKPQMAERKQSKASPPPTSAASMISIATHNLINMVAVSAVSGAVLLTLLVAKHF